MSWRCVECSAPAPGGLSVVETDGSVEPARCRHCGLLVDKFVELDSVNVFLALVLLQPRVFRHLVYNCGWLERPLDPPLLKFGFMALLAEAYTRLACFLVYADGVERRYGGSEGSEGSEGSSTLSPTLDLARVVVKTHSAILGSVTATFVEFARCLLYVGVIELPLLIVGTYLCLRVFDALWWRNGRAERVGSRGGDRAGDGDNRNSNADALGGPASPRGRFLPMVLAITLGMFGRLLVVLATIFPFDINLIGWLLSVMVFASVTEALCAVMWPGVGAGRRSFGKYLAALACAMCGFLWKSLPVLLVALRRVSEAGGGAEVVGSLVGGGAKGENEPGGSQVPGVPSCHSMSASASASAVVHSGGGGGSADSASGSRSSSNDDDITLGLGRGTSSAGELSVQRLVLHAHSLVDGLLLRPVGDCCLLPIAKTLAVPVSSWLVPYVVLDWSPLPLFDSSAGVAAHVCP